MRNRAAESRTKRLLRINAIAAGLLSMLAGSAFFFGAFPFHKLIGWLAISSSVFYLAYAALLDRICETCYRQAGIGLSLYGVLVITAAIYATGGVLSPFTFLYIVMLVSEAIYGLDNSYTMPCSLAGYIFVVCGLTFGFLPNPAPWSAEIYRYPVGVLLIAVLAVAYIVITRSMSGSIVTNLREKLEAEGAEKDALVRKFSELNSTTQLGVLAHRIAHDLRGPIASISGYLEIELLKQRPEEEKRDLRALGETVDAMTETLQGITRFGKPGGASAERLGLAGFMRDIVAIAAFAPRAKGVSFEVVEDGVPSAETVASRADLQQAYFNIIKNAVEAVADNPDAKRVLITVKRAGKDALVLISDNGPGIPEETLRDIFRKSVTTKKDGTGVGLLITRDLIVRNRGEIKLRNAGGGLTVETALPLA